MPDPKNSSQPWDSSSSAFKFIFGLFLVVGLLSSFRFGITQLFFLKSVPVQNTPTKINLIETPEKSISKGYFEITGYAGPTLEYTYYDPGNTGARSFFYYTLSGTSSSTLSPKILVEHHESQHFFLQTDISQIPKEKQQITVRGIIGIGGIPNEISKYFVSSSPLLLVSEEERPQLSQLLLWFIPVSLGFITGLVLVGQWLYKVKKRK